MSRLERFRQCNIASPTHQIKRGADTFTESLFTMRLLDDFVPENYPLMIAAAKQVADEKVQITLSADKGCDAAEFVEAQTEMKVALLVAQHASNSKAVVPDHVAATDGYVISRQKRKLIDQWFGRAKTIGPIRQVMLHGVKMVGQLFVPTMVGIQPHAYANTGTTTSADDVKDEKR